MGIWNHAIFAIQTFWRSDLKWSGLGYGYNFWQDGSHLLEFQIVGLLDCRSYLKSKPFAAQPLFHHLKSRLAQISDPHCPSFEWKFWNQKGINKQLLVCYSVVLCPDPSFKSSWYNVIFQYLGVLAPVESNHSVIQSPFEGADKLGFSNLKFGTKLYTK